MEINGVLKVKFDIEQVSEKFRKRLFVLTHGDKYPQHVTFQLSQDKVNLLDAYKIGDTITVHYNLEGREYNGKYYNQITAWKISGESANKSEPDSNDRGIDADQNLPF